MEKLISKTNLMNHLPLTDPNVMHWRNWHFGKVKKVSDQDVNDFVAMEIELRKYIPSASLDYIVTAFDMGASIAGSMMLPRALAVKNKTIQSLASQYDVHPDIILIRLKEILKKNKNIPRYADVMHLYNQQKRGQSRDRS